MIRGKRVALRPIQDQERILRRASFRDGQWRDMAIHGVLREEWEQQ